jgi:predicted PurR-regulated permease PerM
VVEETSSPRDYRPFLAFLSLVLVTAALYLAQQVLIPVALAILLAFVLSPVVSWLQRRGLPRTPAVAVAVVLAFAVLITVGLTIIWQLQSLAKDLPQYEGQITAKLAAARDATRGTFLENFQNFIQNVSKELQPGQPAAPAGAGPAYPGEEPEEAPAPRPPPALPGLSFGLPQVQAIVSPAIELTASAVLAVVLVIFMLVGREDLRNRVVRLLGPGQVVSTTRAIDDSARRLSRYLLMQACTNAVVGVTLTVGLWLMHVPYFFLWGFLAFALRFIPYAGTWSVAILLAVFCFAVSPGWWQPVGAFGYFAAIEVVMSQVIEPLLFGHTTGVSPVALVIAIAFWTWLWGPVGLMLSIPLTTCLAVLGKYLPQLELFDVLLGDEPVLDEPTRYYQRLLARDQDEATDLAEAYLQAHNPAETFDRLLLPALVWAKRDHERGELPLEDEQFVFEVTRSILDDLADREEAPPDGAAGRARVPVIGCPVRDKADELALEMFRQLAAAAGCRVEVLSAQTLSAEVVGRVKKDRPAVVCVAAVPPGGLAQALYLTKRLRRQFPDLKILVGLWGQQELPPRVAGRLQHAGADQVAATLQEGRNQLVPLVQVAAAAPARAGGREVAAGAGAR